MSAVQKLTLARVFASTFCELIAVLMLMPVMTLRLAARAEPPWVIGFFGATLYVAIFIVTPFAAACTRRFGLRATYVLSGSTPLLAVAIVLATSQLAWWFLAAVVLGLFGGLRWVTAEAYVAEVAPANRRGVVIGAFETMVGACFVIGPLLISWTGIDGARPLWVCGGLLLLGIACLFGLPSLVTHGEVSSRVAFTQLARERPLIVIAALIGGMLESTPTTFLPVVSLASGAAAATAAMLVAVLGVGGFICQVPVGHYADRRPLDTLFRLCLWGVLAGGGALLAAVHWPMLLWPIALVWGAAAGGIYTLAMITIGHAYSGVALVGATAALVFAYSLGGAAGPALAGLAIDLAPQAGLPLLMCTVALVGLALIRQ
jgi:MFS family permease